MHNIHNAVTVLTKYLPLTCALKTKQSLALTCENKLLLYTKQYSSFIKKLAKYPNILPHLCKNSHIPENSKTNSLIAAWIIYLMYIVSATYIPSVVFVCN